MAGEEDVVLINVCCSNYFCCCIKKRRQGRRSCWVRQFGTFNKLFYSSRVRPVRSRWRRTV